MKKHRYELSVVMTTWQRGYAIDWALLSLIDQEEPPDEVIVIDDGSTDYTRPKVEYIQEKRPEANIRYFHNNNPEYTTTAYGFNCGIKQATKPLILLTAGDVVHPSPDVRIIKEYFDDPANDKFFLMANRMYWLYGEGYIQAMKKLYYPDKHKRILLRNDIHKWYPGYISPDNSITYFRPGGEEHIAGILKKHLMAIGGWDEEFCKHGACASEDADLTMRLQEYGVKRIRTDDMVIIHLGHDNTKDPNWRTPTEEEVEFLQKRLERNFVNWRTNIGHEWGKLKE